ncbi:MAG: UDP-glucose/GDP-mannose dehydrogenase family protein [Actinomycetota bacterium]
MGALDCCVIGTGYVGLVTGACLADLGHSVVCADRDEAKVAGLSTGEVPIYEAGLETVVRRNLDAGRLHFTSDIDEAVGESELVFITVDTPSDAEGRADLTHVDEVARDIAAAINSYKVIINKSTVPVGTTKRVQRIIEEAMPEYHEFDVVSNPEFLREGTAVADFKNPSRVVVGSDSQKAIDRMLELYEPMSARVMITDPVSAEMVKYASNAFLATKVSYINAIANLCEVVGADVIEVARGMGHDERIGRQFLMAGPGFGGSCFPKDCRALLHIAREHDYSFDLLEGVLQVNTEQHERMVEKIRHLAGAGEDLRGKVIGLLGLAFKANTDDTRESPAVYVARGLIEDGATVLAFDPEAMERAREELEGASFMEDAYAAARGADVLVLLTEWDEFKWLDYARVLELMRCPVILDTRNWLDAKALRKLGFTYEGVGR